MSDATQFLLSRDFWRENLPFRQQAFGSIEALLWIVAQAVDGDEEEWNFACRADTLAKTWSWTERKVHRFLREMQTAGFILRDHRNGLLIIGVADPDRWRVSARREA